jgi:Branched-chain amino acid aminotransferase/4-amino-4-deoxychorismate lyase
MIPLLRDSFFEHFCCMSFVSLNGSLLPSDQPLIKADNRGFKYGDGFFETIKVQNGSIQLMKYHFDRIIKSATILKMDIGHIEKQLLTNEILYLCTKNNCIKSGRIRVAFYRAEKEKVEYIIEAVPFTEGKKSNFSIDLFTDIQKPIDILSNLKTANYLPCVLASLFISSNSLEDCLIANTKGNICDSSKANVFIVKDGKIMTPALTEGCVDGTMRRYLLKKAKEINIGIREDAITLDNLLNADEVFLTNAIIGIQSVTNCREHNYSDTVAKDLYEKFFQPFDQLIVD